MSIFNEKKSSQLIVASALVLVTLISIVQCEAWDHSERLNFEDLETYSSRSDSESDVSDKIVDLVAKYLIIVKRVDQEYGKKSTESERIHREFENFRAKMDLLKLALKKFNEKKASTIDSKLDALAVHIEAILSKWNVKPSVRGRPTKRLLPLYLLLWAHVEGAKLISEVFFDDVL